MKEKYKPTYYDLAEERINIWTHGFGIIASIFGLYLLVRKATQVADTWGMVSYMVYGLSLIILYTASTAYHAAKGLKLRTRLNIFDHAAIYVLIAGTYTPYALITLQGSVGWWVFGIIWSFASIGVVLKLFFTGKYDKLSTVMYVLMGWLMVFAAKPLTQSLPSEGVEWLIWGGVAYTIGAILYSFKRLKYNHAIFHIFVLLGSLFHFISIYYYC